MRLRVYIAGPYSSDPARNVRAAVQAADLLLSQGYAPYVPHLTHLWDLIAPRPYEDWIALDLEWLCAANLVVRLDGDSPGADRETTEARRLGIPVVSLEDAMLGVIKPRVHVPAGPNEPDGYVRCLPSGAVHPADYDCQKDQSPRTDPGALKLKGETP